MALKVRARRESIPNAPVTIGVDISEPNLILQNSKSLREMVKRMYSGGENTLFDDFDKPISVTSLESLPFISYEKLHKHPRNSAKNNPSQEVSNKAPKVDDNLSSCLESLHHHIKLSLAETSRAEFMYTIDDSVFGSVCSADDVSSTVDTDRTIGPVEMNTDDTNCTILTNCTNCCCS
jgi:hypothetical protein